MFLDGEYGDPAWYRTVAARADILLAADGGAAFLAREGLVPQAVVGDFDSLDESLAAALAGQGVELIRHPVRKDVTDGELAVEEALRRGAGELVLAGATGALDHTLGHLAILRRLASRGVAARLVAPDLAAAVLIAPAEVALAAPAGVRVSLAPVGADATGDARGVRLPALTAACLARATPVSGSATTSRPRARPASSSTTARWSLSWSGARRRSLRAAGRGDGVTPSLRAWRVAAAAWAGAILVTGMLPDAGRLSTRSPAGRDDLVDDGGTLRRLRAAGVPARGRARGLEGEARPGGPGAGAGGALGGLIELVQLPLPYRDGQLVDVARQRRGGRRRSGGVQCCGAGEATTIASRMMLAATSSAGTS